MHGAPRLIFYNLKFKAINWTKYSLKVVDTKMN